MLMSNQEHHQKAYVSPYQQRDDMKESHIKVGVEGNQKKYEEI